MTGHVPTLTRWMAIGALALLPLTGRADGTGPMITDGDKKLPMKGESFRLDGHDAFMILPPESTRPVPWVWYAPTLPGLPSQHEKWLFDRLLAEGIAIAGIDVGESYGSPDGRALFQKLHDYLVDEKGFSSTPCLLARSRGGLMLYNWAVEHPTKVSGIAGIYPVCNIASYPGIPKACGAYRMTAAQLEAALGEHNPIDRLKPLAAGRVPILHIHGDKDSTVPLEQNSALVAERYRALGGDMRLEVVEGRGHDVWPGWFQSQAMADFIIDRARSGREADPE